MYLVLICKMKNLFIIMTALITLNAATAGESYVLTQEQWSQPKRVESVLQMSAINKVLTAFDKSPDNQLLISIRGVTKGLYGPMN